MILDLKQDIYTHLLFCFWSSHGIIDNLVKKRNIFTHLISYNKCPTNHGDSKHIYILLLEIIRENVNAPMSG